MSIFERGAGIKVLSLFDGMSCTQIALKKLGVQVDNYYASEIDKYAIQVAQQNFPDTIQLGNVRGVQAKDLPEIDLLVGGSPCQGFSFAGKGLNFADERSKLFFHFARILAEVKPKYFILENVRMNKKSKDLVSTLLGVEPLTINSRLVSAQNRPRQYWTNIPVRFFPADKNILLKDILERETATHYRAGQKLLDNYRGGNQLNPSYKSQANTIHDIEGKVFTLCAGTHGYGSGYVPESGNPRIFRKLTPTEFERLQTVPDGYTSGVSNTQRYKMLGNGMTVDVIAYLLSGITKI